MRKRLAVIGLVLAAGLGAAALAGGGMDGLFPPDPAEGLPVVTLAEGPEGLSLHLYSYEYTLTELLREESFYTDGVLQPTDRGAQHAYRGTMLHRQLEPVYSQLTDLCSRIGESYPAHMSLPQQGSFQLGYYHQTQARYQKKGGE